MSETGQYPESGQKKAGVMNKCYVGLIRTGMDMYAYVDTAFCSTLVHSSKSKKTVSFGRELGDAAI